jgi:hypothetical protein
MNLFSLIWDVTQWRDWRFRYTQAKRRRAMRQAISRDVERRVQMGQRLLPPPIFCRPAQGRRNSRKPV